MHRIWILFLYQVYYTIFNVTSHIYIAVFPSHCPVAIKTKWEYWMTFKWTHSWLRDHNYAQTEVKHDVNNLILLTNIFQKGSKQNSQQYFQSLVNMWKKEDHSVLFCAAWIGKLSNSKTNKQTKKPSSCIYQICIFFPTKGLSFSRMQTVLVFFYFYFLFQSDLT